MYRSVCDSDNACLVFLNMKTVHLVNLFCCAEIFYSALSVSLLYLDTSPCVFYKQSLFFQYQLLFSVNLLNLHKVYAAQHSQNTWMH